MNTYLVNDEKIVTREIDGNLIILDTEKGDFLSIEGTGKFIFERISKQMPVKKIINELRTGFKIDEKIDISEDVNSFIKELLERQIIRENR